MDASKILDALSHAVKALDVVTVTASELAAMFQRLVDKFSPGEPSTLASAELNPLCQAIVLKAAERLQAE